MRCHEVREIQEDPIVFSTDRRLWVRGRDPCRLGSKNSCAHLFQLFFSRPYQLEYNFVLFFLLRQSRSSLNVCTYLFMSYFMPLCEFGEPQTLEPIISKQQKHDLDQLYFQPSKLSKAITNNKFDILWNFAISLLFLNLS